jgi:hypothetical protein
MSATAVVLLSGLLIVCTAALVIVALLGEDW